MGDVVAFLQRSADAAAKRAKRNGLSQYDRYPLPFFDAEHRSVWAIEPTGGYGVDCETGRAFAIDFLESNDGSAGWATLLTQIVRGMIGAGPSGYWPDGEARTNGVVVGFMNAIGKALCASDTPALARALRAEREGDPGDA